MPGTFKGGNNDGILMKGFRPLRFGHLLDRIMRAGFRSDSAGAS